MGTTKAAREKFPGCNTAANNRVALLRSGNASCVFVCWFAVESEMVDKSMMSEVNGHN